MKFQHWHEARLAIHEAILLARHYRDEVCLGVAIGWHATINAEQEKNTRNLTDARQMNDNNGYSGNDLQKSSILEEFAQVRAALEKVGSVLIIT